MAEQKASTQELSYAEARPEILKINPGLVKAIDACNPDKKHKLFKITYPYGSEILKRAEFFLPNSKGEIVSIDDSSIEKHVRESLNYNVNSNPVMMVLNHAAELFLPLEDRTIPMGNLISAPTIFGTYRILTRGKLSNQPAFIWDMTAGARSIFMLAKISDAEKHKKLRRTFDLTSDKPQIFFDHWKVFREIANHKNFPNPWQVDLLAFSKHWFEHFDDKSWMPFNYYLYRTVWNGGDFLRNVYFWNVIFSLIQKEHHYKPSAYITDTIKHLLAIGIGEASGFFPAIDDSAAPISGLQEIYLSVYNLKQAPIIMEPGLLLLNNNARPVYYSFRFPSAMELGGKSRNRDNFANDIIETRSLLNHYIKRISSNEYNLEETPYYEYLNNISYEYFHEGVNIHGLKKATDIIATDSSYVAPSSCKNISFPYYSSFFKGCIKISYKK